MSFSEVSKAKYLPSLRFLRNIIIGLGGKVEGLDGQGNLTMSPDSCHIAIGDGFNVRILDSSNGETLHLLSGHNHFVGSVVFSPDGQDVITYDSNSTMRIWNVESGHCIASHVSDSGVMWPEIVAWPYIITNTKSGKPSILRLENAPALGGLPARAIKTIAPAVIETSSAANTFATRA